MATDEFERVLLPIRVLEGQTLDEDLAALLVPMDVLLLGYHVVPEQTPPGQMRNQFEAQAQAALATMVEAIIAAGGSAESRLVFTHDEDQSIDRVGAEWGATARVYPNPVSPVESVLAVFGDAIDPRRLGAFLGRLRADRPMDITVLVVSSSDEGVDKRIDELRVALAAAELPIDAIAIEVPDSRRLRDVILAESVSHDVTVLGPHRADWRSHLFGDLNERIAAKSVGPVLEVFDPPLGSDEDGQETDTDGRETP